MNKKITTLLIPDARPSEQCTWPSYWGKRDQGIVRGLPNNWGKLGFPLALSLFQSELFQQASPITLIAHGLGCAVLLRWIQDSNARYLDRISGALLVAPSDPTNAESDYRLCCMPLFKLPFASIVVASSTDPTVKVPVARRYAEAWGGRFVLLFDAGRIDDTSGFAKWPEGYMLLRELRRAAVARAAGGKNLTMAPPMALAD